MIRLDLRLDETRPMAAFETDRPNERVLVIPMAVASVDETTMVVALHEVHRFELDPN